MYRQPGLSRRFPLPVRLVGLVACVALGAAAVGRPGTQRPAPPRAVPLVVMIREADWMGPEWSEDAIELGLKESDLEKDRDYQLRISSAQGDLATLAGLIDAALDSKAAVIVALQDETLRAAVSRVKTTPVVFHLLSDPFAAGAGTSDSNHLPNFTGVYSPGFGDPEQSRRVELIRRVVPDVRVIGILYSPGEPLSVTFKDRMSAAAGKAGLKVVAVPVNSMGDVGEATQSLCSQKVGAIELYGNIAHAGFASLIQAAKACKVPVFSPSPFEVMQGAILSFFPDFQEGGVMAGRMIARVLRGESPASMPFYQVRTTKLAVNPGEASQLGIPLSPDLVKEADTVVGPAPRDQ